MHRPDLRKNVRAMTSQNAGSLPKRNGHSAALSQRARGNGRNDRGPYAPPEDWYDPQGLSGRNFRIIAQAPGRGYRHAVTEDEVRQRLEDLPDYMLEPLEVVQLSRITRKKKSFPCYGMQWGSTLYLYAIEETLTEFFAEAPSPAQWNEARMYGVGGWKFRPTVGNSCGRPTRSAISISTTS